MKVLLARRALVYSFLNLNYLEQKHCCLKSAFSGAYFSRLPLTQDWLPFFFSGLTCPHMTPDPLTQTFPCHFHHPAGLWQLQEMPALVSEEH